MNLQKTSAIAELVSAIAIVVTLAYLAIETRQNTLATQATVRQAMLEVDLELLFKQMEYPPILQGLYNADELSDEEFLQYSTWLVAFFRVRESHWFQYKNGVIDETTWNAYRSPLRSVLASDFAKTSWKMRSERGDFDMDFVANVNDYLSRTGTLSETSVMEALGIDRTLK